VKLQIHFGHTLEKTHTKVKSKKKLTGSAIKERCEIEYLPKNDPDSCGQCNDIIDQNLREVLTSLPGSHQRTPKLADGLGSKNLKGNTSSYRKNEQYLHCVTTYKRLQNWYKRYDQEKN